MATKTKKAPKPRARKSKVKQPYLETEEGSMAPPSIKAIDHAADGYYEVMMERCKLSKLEDEGKQNLIAKMRDYGVGHYVTAEGLVVDVTDKTNVRVKRRHEESNGEA